MKRRTDVTTDLSASANEQHLLRRVHIAAILLLGWLVLPWWMILGTTPTGEMVFVVCVLFMLFAFGIASVAVIRALHNRIGRRKISGNDDTAPAASASRRATEIFTGPLPLVAAAVQILLIPASVAIGFTALAVVDIFVRT